MFTLVDSHCHLNMLMEKDNLAEIVKRAHAKQVHYMQTICTKLADFPTILKIAEDFENIYASVGVHPDEVKEIVSHIELETLSSHPKIIGLGETGLDYYRDSSYKKNQIKSFAEHIIAAQNTRLPIIVHTRDAENDTIEVIESEMKNHEFFGLIHCFTASKNFAKKMLDLGIYISISGIVTFKNAEHLREIVEFIPLDRLLIETDSPYLAPTPMRGCTNEPAFVSYVANNIASIKNLPLEVVAQQTTENFFKLFKKAQKIEYPNFW